MPFLLLDPYFRTGAWNLEVISPKEIMWAGVHDLGIVGSSLSIRTHLHNNLTLLLNLILI